jgi:translation initiation factor 4A
MSKDFKNSVGGEDYEETENVENVENVEQDTNIGTPVPEVTDENEFETVNKTWEDLQLKPEVLRGVFSYGFEHPSPIQRKAIGPLMSGRDIIAQAQSGTGKTGAFSISAQNMVDVEKNHTQFIILGPTRELATQIYEFNMSIGKHLKGLNVKLLIGGVDSELDIEEMNKQVPHIIVGTPGRVHDMIRRSHINTNKLRLIILDEADEMLSQGFKEQIYRILQYLPKNVQVALFSASIPEELNILTTKFLRNPQEILIKKDMLTLEGIMQYYVAIESDQHKYLTLKDLYGKISVSQCIIYCNSVKRVSDLYDAMLEDEFPVGRIHSSMDKEDRERSYNEFKKGKYRVLISSNLTARGIDIQQVSTIINFDLPRDVHTYLHRIGRSGRWGRKGVSINFATRFDFKRLKEFEEFYSTQIMELPETF